MKTSTEDNAINKAMDELFTRAKTGDEEALAIISEIFHKHFKEMQKISFRKQMRQNHKIWMQYKLNHNRF